MYCFVDWKQTGKGLRPALPEGMGFLLLAEPSEQGTYGLFKVNISKEKALPLQIQAISEELADLIDAAEQYAPALALARDEVQQVSGVTRVAFSEALASYLRDYLASQRTSPFFLAAAKRTELGYKYAGAFYWIVGYRPEQVGREISWVSRDFFVYQDGLADFDCDLALLEDRFLATQD